jgi:hypothetical protein
MPRPTFTKTQPTWNVPDDDSRASYRMTVCVLPNPLQPPLIITPETCPGASRQPGSRARPRVVLFHWPPLGLLHLGHSPTSFWCCYRESVCSAALRSPHPFAAAPLFTRVLLLPRQWLHNLIRPPQGVPRQPYHRRPTGTNVVVCHQALHET